MTSEDDKQYLVGRVYPRDQCFGHGPDKSKTSDISDNFPDHIMDTMSLKNIPLTSGHPPLNKKVEHAPEIIRGKVERSFINSDGDLWAVAVLDTKNMQGKRLMENVKNGKQMGLSLGHVYQMKHDQTGSVWADKYVPDHLGIVEDPRRENCYVYHFASKKNLPSSFNADHIASLTKEIARLPATRTTVVCAGREYDQPIEVINFETCSLGTMMDPETMTFAPSTIQYERTTILSHLSRKTQENSIWGHAINLRNSKSGTYSELESRGVRDAQKKSARPLSQHKATYPYITEKIQMASRQLEGPSGTFSGPDSRLKGGPGTYPPATPASDTHSQKVGMVPQVAVPATKQQVQPISGEAGGTQAKPDATTTRDPEGMRDGKDAHTAPSSADGAPTEEQRSRQGRVVKVADIQEEYSGMSEAVRLKAMADMMTNINLQAINEEKRLAVLQKEIADLKEAKNADEKREAEKVYTSIAAHFANVTAQANTVVEASGNTNVKAVNPISLYNEVSADMSLDKKRKLSELMFGHGEIIQVATRQQGMQQLEENTRKRQMMTSGGGNDSIFAYTKHGRSAEQTSIFDFLRAEQQRSASPRPTAVYVPLPVPSQETSTYVSSISSYAREANRPTDISSYAQNDRSFASQQNPLFSDPSISRPMSDDFSGSHYADFQRGMATMGESMETKKRVVTSRIIDPMQE